MKQRDPEARPHLPINCFFQSLAQERDAGAVGVVLSGTGTDGTDGARAIKAAEGIIVAQDPETASFSGMPRSLVERRLCDMVLAPESILRRLVDYMGHYMALRESESENGFEQALSVLQECEDIELRSYRTRTLYRRIQRRMSLHGIDSSEGYARRLREDATERAALIEDVYIGVTRFFRDPAAFDSLREELAKLESVPELFRVWCCGCSTGQEAYTLAMILFEDLVNTERAEFKIFATDVSEGALEKASAGSFHASEVEDIPPHYLEKYFRRTHHDRYVCDSEIRNRIVFSRHDALRDPPFAKINLVTCRNLLIYLDKSAQDRIIASFSFSLLSKGILFLGPSESAPDRAKNYTEVDSRWRIFQSLRSQRSPRFHWSPPLSQSSPEARVDQNSGLPSRDGSLSWLDQHDELSGRFAPAHLLLDEEGNIVYQRGELLSRLLRLPQGHASMDIRKLAVTPLDQVITAVLQKAIPGKDIAVPSLKLDGLESPIEVSCRSLVSLPKYRVLYFRLLSEIAPDQRHDPSFEPLEIGDINAELRDRVTSLELSLKMSNETVHNTVEELESSNEELQSTNEELLASNEELQSVNEELQSVNEELHTVNHEHQDKILELGESNSALAALLSSVEDAVICLDKDLNVRRANPKATRYIPIAEQDLGRPLAHFSHRLGDMPLADLCGQAVREQKRSESLIRGLEGEEILLVRIVPMDPDGSSGLILTVTDLTSTEKLRRSQESLTSALDSVDLPLATLDLQGVITYANHTLTQASNLDSRYVVGTPSAELLAPGSRETWSEALARVLTGDSWEGYLEPIGSAEEGAGELVRLSPVLDETGKVEELVRITVFSAKPSPASGFRRGNVAFLQADSLGQSELARAGRVAKELLMADSDTPLMRFVAPECVQTIKATLRELRGETELKKSLSFKLILAQNNEFLLKVRLRRYTGSDLGIRLTSIEWLDTTE